MLTDNCPAAVCSRADIIMLFSIMSVARPVPSTAMLFLPKNGTMYGIVLYCSSPFNLAVPIGTYSAAHRIDISLLELGIASTIPFNVSL